MPTIIDKTLSGVLETLADAVFATDARGIILWSNAAAERMFGRSCADFLGANIACIVPEPHKHHHDSYLDAFARERKPLTHVLGVDQRLEAERRDGSRFPVEVGLSAFTCDGEMYYIGFVRDLSEREAAESRMYDLANHDQVTGLANRFRLMAETSAALRDGRECTMAVLGLIGLRRIGERHGHGATEHVLKVVADRLRAAIGERAGLARASGELLAGLFFPTISETCAGALVEVAAQPVRWGSIDLRVSATVGLAHTADAGASGEEMLRAARAAAGFAQIRKGPGSVATYTEALGASLRREAEVEAGLRAAVAEERLTVALQPKVRAADGRVVGAEALARWTDTRLGAVSPGEFVPVAERSGIIGDLGDLIMRIALREAAGWGPDGEGVTVAINISAVDLRQAGLVARVRQRLEESGSDPARVVVELTESALADDPDQAKRQLWGLKDLGISLSLDDFGTGYSSLAYLRRFPIDKLKIDQSFVRDVPRDADAVALVRSIVGLARALRMSTVAEGVETVAQADILRDAGVDVFQGYLFSRPLAPAAFRALIAQTPVLRPA